MRGPRSRGMTAFRAGILALVVLGVFSYFGFSKANPFANPYQLEAMFDNANNLTSRSPVRIAGVDVGKVKKVERGPGALATVTMELEQRALPLHRDATVKIRPRIFLEGNFFIDLGPGTPSAPEMKDGGTIPLAQTAIPVQLDQVLTSLRRSNRRDLLDVVDGLGESLADGGASPSSLPNRRFGRVLISSTSSPPRSRRASLNHARRRGRSPSRAERT